ncbi:hypothetical protein PUN73_04450 [Bordetella pertussis]|nr:hypothetical protein PUN73_04450 [Bordetella pertussis]
MAKLTAKAASVPANGAPAAAVDWRSLLEFHSWRCPGRAVLNMQTDVNNINSLAALGLMEEIFANYHAYRVAKQAGDTGEMALRRAKIETLAAEQRRVIAAVCRDTGAQ